MFVSAAYLIISKIRNAEPFLHRLKVALQSSTGEAHDISTLISSWFYYIRLWSL